MKNFKTLLLALGLAYSSMSLLATGCGFAGDWGGGWYSSGNLWAGWAYDGPYRAYIGPSNHDKALDLTKQDEIWEYTTEIKILGQENNMIQKNSLLSTSEKEKRIDENKARIKEYTTLMNILYDK